jgi:phage FluMu protein Com
LAVLLIGQQDDGTQAPPSSAFRGRPQGSRQGAREGPRDDDNPCYAVRRGASKGEALIRTADQLLCESWNERMWADGEPIDPSPTIDQAINGGYSWLEIECSRCKSRRNVDLAGLPHPPTTFVHDLAGRLRCSKCSKANRRPAATLLQLAERARQTPET